MIIVGEMRLSRRPQGVGSRVLSTATLFSGGNCASSSAVMCRCLRGLSAKYHAYTTTHTAVSAPTSTNEARHEANATSNAIKGGVISDRILKRTGSVVSARRNMIIVAFLGALVFLAPVMVVKSLPVMAASLSLSFFFLEMTIGPIWAVPMDITPKHVGIASGLVNAGSAIAGIFSPIVFGFVVDRTGSWTLPFAGSLGLLAVGIVMTFFMRPDIALDSAAASDNAGRTAHGELKLAERRSGS